MNTMTIAAKKLKTKYFQVQYSSHEELTTPELDEQINVWLAEQNDQTQVLDIKLANKNGAVQALVLYTDQWK